MNAIISLCHFCEVHGPSILFCTQAFHTPEPQNVLPGQLSPAPGVGCNLNPRERDRLRSSTSDSDVTTCTQPPQGSKTDLCEACRSFAAGQAGFVSIDHEAKVRYVSSQHPNHPQVFSMVRTGCIRSLSCEVCPGREGPIFFGDEHHGHVFSHTFMLKDSQARGFERNYSIIVVMMDRVFLLNSWPFLVANVKDIINELQGKATAVYDDEQARCPQRAHRLGTRYQRGGSKSARSLVELTNDRLVFHRLHQSFTFILKAGGTRLTERLLEGPPTEDSIIDLEKQEETEDGFVILHSIKRTDCEVADDIVETDDPTVPMFTGLRHMMKILGYQRFHSLIHHVVIGNQVIVRASKRKICHSVIDSLKVLLPRGCCRIIYYSDTYEDSWRCNFLGVPPSTDLPQHTDLYVCVDITSNQTDASEKPLTDNSFSDFTIDVTSPKTLPEKVPALLNKMELALFNEKLADSVVEQCLVCIKEEWMNKVKVLFKFTKAGGNRSEEDTKKLLNVVGVNNEDKMVLQFWMTGLSVQYRNHMLSSAICHSK